MMTGDTGPGIAYRTQSIQFFNRTAGLDATRRWLYNRMIAALVDGGVWSLIDVFYIFAAPTSTIALTNLVQSNFGGTANGSPTFTANVGYTGTDASSTVYIDSGFNPTTATTPNYVQNSAHMSVWSNTSTASSASGGNDMGSSTTGGTQTSLNCRYSTNQAFLRCNDVTPGANGVASADGSGHFLISRDNSTTQNGYRNAVNQTVTSKTSSNPANQNILILNQQTSGTISGGSGRQNCGITIGGALNSTQVTTLYNAMHSFLQAVAGVA